MSAAIERIRRTARQRIQRLILPEGGDERAVRAAGMLRRDALAEVSLGGAPAEVRDAARRADVALRGIGRGEEDGLTEGDDEDGNGNSEP